MVKRHKLKFVYLEIVMIKDSFIKMGARFAVTNLALLCSFAVFNPVAIAADALKDDALKTNIEFDGAVVVPTEVAAPDISMLKVPNDFEIRKLIEGLGNTRILAVSPNGKLYVTRREEGDIKMINLDTNGQVNGTPVTVARRSGMHGLSFNAGKAYMVSAHEVFVADVKTDGTFGPLKMIIHDLPAAGQHNNRTIEVGPDAKLYISVGSTCNICNESSPENATILQTNLDGKQRAIFASGLRNTIGFDWHPMTGQLWGMDQGIDWHGDDVMVEELNLIEKGKRFGWPYLYANNQIVPRIEPPGKLSKAEWKINSQPSTLGYTSHAASMQMAFYNHNQFPAEYKNNAFVAMRGSWNRSQPSGYEIVRVKFEEGKPTSIMPFVTGFLSKEGSSGRPVGVAVMPDGSLVFSDDQNGAIYRVSYKNITNNTKNMNNQVEHKSSDKFARNIKVGLVNAPSMEMNLQAVKGSGVPIAINRTETALKENSLENSFENTTITLTTPAFKQNQAIPNIYSGYDQDNSFQLNWSKGPTNTKSYVLVMEDPDSRKPPIPVVHWLVWNLPASMTSLPEGLKKQDRLVEPDGVRQGATSTGKIGYMGPKPPKGDPAHHYHTQIFALDTALNLPAGVDRDQLLQAINGHVIAKGELIGQFVRPDKPTKP